MKEKAAAIGEKVRSVSLLSDLCSKLLNDIGKQEDGARSAIHAIYTYYSRASQDRASLD